MWFFFCVCVCACVCALGWGSLHTHKTNYVNLQTRACGDLTGERGRGGAAPCAEDGRIISAWPWLFASKVLLFHRRCLFLTMILHSYCKNQRMRPLNRPAISFTTAHKSMGAGGFDFRHRNNRRRDTSRCCTRSRFHSVGYCASSIQRSV